MGRVNSPMPRGQRNFEVLSDGATMSYDVFEPTIKHDYQGLSVDTSNDESLIEANAVLHSILRSPVRHYAKTIVWCL